MSKLVDKERLAKLAKALDQRAKAGAAQAEANAKAHAEAKDEVLANRIQALEGLVVGGEGEGLEAVIGDVAQNKADIAELKEFKEGHSHEELEAGIEAADAKAQAAKEAMDAFMLAADVKEGAVDTLKEIQEYIESDGAAAEEMVAKIAAAEKAVEDEQIRAEAQEAAIRAEFAAADVVVKEEINAELEEMGNQFSELLGGLQEEYRDIRSAFELADANMKAELKAEIDADVEVEKQRAEAKELEIANRVNELDTAINDLDMEMSSQIQGVAGDVAQLQTGQEEIGSRLGALEGFKNAHSHEAMEEAIEELQEELVGKVGEEEVKAMLGNVVSSLSLQMVDNKVQLTLGGVEGIAIAEAELDIADDQDIDDIIAGLDEE